MAAPAAARAEPAVTIAPAAGPPGTTVVVRGDGYEPQRRLLVMQQGRRPAHLRTSSRGAFRARLTIRPAARGTHPITTIAGRRHLVNHFHVGHPAGPARVSERVTARGRRIRWSPTAGSPGAHVTLAGWGFGPRRPVEARLGAATAAARTDAGGHFTTRLVAGAGAAELSVRGGGARVEAPFRLTPDPVVAAAGDIACDPRDPNFNGGEGVPGACRQRHTSDVVLAMKPTAVLVLGDIQYESSQPEHWPVSYGPSWGRFKDITWPVMGNHENAGGNPRAYFDYFGPRVGTPDRAYYSFDLGAWHLVALNTNYENCGELRNVNCANAGAQEAWLRADLAAHPQQCVLAYFHYPRFSSGDHGDHPTVQGIWEILHAARADVVLTGHDHDYERFAPQDPLGVADPINGIRQFVVGTGGKDFRSFPRVKANSEARNNHAHGVLRLGLHQGGYDWAFVPEAGASYSDSGTAQCH